MTGPPSPFLGRRVALDRVNATVAAAVERRPGILLVAGPAGIGKTRLVREAAAGWDGRVTFLHGGAVSIGGEDLPFAPITAALRRVDPPWPPADAPTDATGRLRVLEGLLDTLDQLATEAPVALVLEDLHWADPSTRSAIDYLARNLTDEPVALICTYRDDELHRGHPWRPVLGELVRLERVETLTLPPLDPDDAVQLAAFHLGRMPDATDRTTIWQRGQGNPFFTEELARAAATGERGIPSTLAAVLERQVGQLPEDVARVLRVAAVVGHGLAPEVIADVAGVPPALAADALRAANDAGFVVPVDDGLAFRHALLREAVESTLLPSERRTLHAAVAARYEAAGVGSVAEATAVARHWHLAGERRRAHEAALTAAALARRNHDHVSALAQLDLAIDTWEPDDGEPGDLPVLLLDAVDVALHAGEAERAVGLARLAEDAARRAGLRDLERRAVAATAHALGTALDYQGAWAAAGVAVAMLDDDTAPAIRSEVLTRAAGVAVVAGQFREARRLADAALTAATDAGRDVDIASALGSKGIGTIALGRVDEGIALLRDSEDRARAAGDSRLAFVARLNHVETLWHVGALRRCVELGTEAVEEARRVGLVRTLAPGSAAVAALAATHLGWLDEARALLDRQPREVLGLAGVVLPIARARVALADGDPDTAGRQLALARSGSDDAMRTFGSAWAAVRLEVALVEDDPVPGVLEALAVSERVADVLLVGTGGWLVARGEAVLATRPDDDPALAAAVESMRTRLDRVLEPVLAAGGDTVSTRPWRELAAAVAGQVPAGGWDALRERLLDADLHGEVAWALLAEALAALSGGDRDTAATLLTTLVDADPPVVGTLAAEVARRARVVRSEGPQRAASEAAGLTGRELDVLRLVADGLTNREISERLYISPKTASVHVSNLMRKLGVDDRRAAAAVARRLGLV